MKKIIAILLSLSIVFTLGIPAFAAEEETEITQELHEEIVEPTVTEEDILELLESEEVQEKLEEEGIDVDDIIENENFGYEYLKDYSAFDLIAEQSKTFLVYAGEYIFEIIISPFGVGALCVVFIGALPLAPVLMIGAPLICAITGVEDFMFLFDCFRNEWAAFLAYNG